MGILGIIIGVIGIAVSIVFSIRSKRITDAFSRYVELEQEVKHLQGSTKDHSQKIKELEELKADIYHHKYKPKSKIFTIGDKVKLIKISQSSSCPMDSLRQMRSMTEIMGGPRNCHLTSGSAEREAPASHSRR